MRIQVTSKNCTAVLTNYFVTTQILAGICSTFYNIFVCCVRSTAGNWNQKHYILVYFLFNKFWQQL